MFVGPGPGRVRFLGTGFVGVLAPRDPGCGEGNRADLGWRKEFGQLMESSEGSEEGNEGGEGAPARPCVSVPAQGLIGPAPAGAEVRSPAD